MCREAPSGRCLREDQGSLTSAAAPGVALPTPPPPAPKPPPREPTLSIDAFSADDCSSSAC